MESRTNGEAFELVKGDGKVGRNARDFSDPCLKLSDHLKILSIGELTSFGYSLNMQSTSQ